MKKLRAIVVLLFSISLPYSATATMLHDLRCHHDGLGALLEGAANGHQHDHLAMHEHAAAQHAGSHQGCDCIVKCQCQHNCAGGGCGAALALTPWGVDVSSGGGFSIGSYDGLMADPQSSSPFRPPIAAPPGAA
ncbi:MAG: hypothetical protein ISP90_00030 [Nevskia sp.]|nr:hypothetical protein [Nevskia sp.]